MLNNKNPGQNGAQKSSKTSMIVIITLIALVATSSFFTSSGANGKYTVSNIDRMNINLKNAKIHIQTIIGKEDKITIEVIATGKYKTSNIRIEANNQSLDIKQTGPTGLFSLRLNSSLEVYLKRETTETGAMFDDTTVSSKSGTITVENFSSKNLIVHSESGVIMFTNVLSEDASLSTSSAMINLNQINVTNKLALKTQSGAIKMKAIRCDELSVHSKSGAINVEELTSSKLETTAENGSSHIVFSGELMKMNAYSSTTSGSIDYIFQNDLPLDIEWTGKKMNCQIASDPNAPNKINLKTESGNLSVSRK